MLSILFKKFWFNLIYGFCLIKICFSKDSFSPIPSNLLNIIQCIPHAYGDFNADKLIDVFCVSSSGNSIEIWLAQDKEVLFYKQKTLTLNNGTIIVNLIPGDFNGDSVIDLLVFYKNNAANTYLDMRLYTGNKTVKNMNDISDTFYKEFSYRFKDQPLASDLNGDGIIDLFGEDEQNGRSYYFFNTDGDIENKPQGSKNPLHIGYSNSVVDLNNDYLPDLVITSETNDKKPVYEVWMRKNENFVLNNSYLTPNGAVIFGQSIFADFDSDSSFEHLLPACKDKDCKNSTIYIYKTDQWFELPIEINEYIFQSEGTNETGDFINGMSFKAADYNLDGYIDLLVIMRDEKSNNRFTVVLKNVPCTELTKCSFSRTFKVDLSINQLNNIHNVYLTSFFDLYDDGSLDIFLLVKDSESNSFNLLAFKNELYDDVYFLKVMVEPGRCDDCPGGTLPYGMNYPTPFIRIETKSFEYKTFKSYASQLSQSSHLSLQLPFVLFGLGSTPNFVDKLTVGIEAPKYEDNSKVESYHREWTSIIPNSQLVISVHPRNNINKWKMQLFLTPSKNILLTGISLGSTMVCLIIVIILLQYREKKIDEKERKLESQRFHFDGL